MTEIGKDRDDGLARRASLVSLEEHGETGGSEGRTFVGRLVCAGFEGRG